MKEVRKLVEEYLQEVIFDKVNLKKISAKIKGIIRPSKEENIVKSSFEDGKLHVSIFFPREGKRMNCYVVNNEF